MKKRLDFLVAEKENISRNKAQSLIKEGIVFVNGKMVNRPAFEVEDEGKITIEKHDAYVSRGAYKLLKGLDEFEVSVEGKMVLDMGASTGGFTQVALLRGASQVLSVDVGRGELNEALKNNSKVVNMEGRDIRTLTKDEVEGVNLVVGDLSFISLKNILPHVKMLLGDVQMILLFKPQFECGKEIARKCRGVVKDKNIHKKLLKEFIGELDILGYELSGITFSPIKGGSGNIEYLMHLNGNKNITFDIDITVENAFLNLKNF